MAQLIFAAEKDTGAKHAVHFMLHGSVSFISKPPLTMRRLQRHHFS
jgi:hypothetical protein